MDVVIGIAMTAHDARLLLVKGTHGDGAVIDHAPLDADDLGSVEHPGLWDRVVNAVVDTHSAAPANGYTVARVALTWTDEAAGEAKQVVDALEEQGINVTRVPSADAVQEAVESVVGESNSTIPRPVAFGDDTALRLARGALLASVDLRDEAAPRVQHDPLMRTLAMVMATAVLIVAGSVFLAVTVRGGHGSAPPQASIPAEHAAPAEPPIHTVGRKVVPMAGQAAQKTLAPDADRAGLPAPGVIRR